MGAKVIAGVSGGKNTAGCTATCTITHARIATSGGTAKTNWKALSGGSQTLSQIGQMLALTNTGVYVTLGATGTANEIADATLVAMLANQFPSGASTDIIQWSEDGSNVSTKLAATSVDTWGTAAAY